MKYQYRAVQINKKEPGNDQTLEYNREAIKKNT